MSALDDLAATDLALNMPISGVQLIEASAGTGKTFTIAGLYVRLVVERKLSARQVLVMTFTRAATEELRQRLRKRLQLCAQWAGSPLADLEKSATEESDVDKRWVLALLQRVQRQGDELPEELARRLRLAVLEMDQAAIYTIDAFCQRVLTSWAMLLDDATQGARIHPSDRDLLEDFAADAWLRAADDDDPLVLQTLQVLGNTPEDLAKLLLALVAFDGVIEPEASPSPDHATDLPDPDAARQAMLDVWREHGHAAVALFEERYEAGHLHGGRYRKGSNQALRELALTLGNGMELGAESLSRFTLSRLQGAVKNGFDPFPRHPAFAAIDDWLDARRAVEQAHRRQVPYVLARIVWEARDWLARRKRELLRMSYDDLVERLADGLMHGSRRKSLAEALREQYPCALIDEFQDTSPRQFSIFDTLYRDAGGLFLIGDPKQAIYGFRGGDVHAYLRAAKRAADSGHAVHHLDRNYRSSADMLTAIEAMFTATGKPFMEHGIDFEAVQWGGGTANGALRIEGDPVPALTLWRVPADKKRSADSLRQYLADVCASTVVRLLDGGRMGAENRPVKPASIAVLVGKNAEAMLVQDTLRRRGVAAVCLRRESIYDSREANELLCLLDALLTPSSLRLARGALATELMGRRLSDLAGMDDDPEVWRAAMGELEQLHDRWFDRGLLAMLEHLAECHAPRLLALSDGERRLGNLLQLGEALQSDAGHLAGERALRDLLGERIRNADAYNEEEQLRLESDAERVQIVTMHRSKGLEYDVVMLPFAVLMGARTPRKGELIKYHHDDTATSRLLLYGKDERTGESVAPVAHAEADACERASDEALAEQVRCLYVGLTRARHACWVSTGMGAVLKHLLPDDGSGEAVAARHAGIIACGEPVADDRALAPETVRQRDVAARRFERAVTRDWWVHSFSQLAASEHDSFGAAPGADDEPSAVDSDISAEVPAQVPSWPRGARYGNAVHAVLEQTHMAVWKDANGCPPGEHFLLERELRAAGYDDDEHALALINTVHLVKAALCTPVVPGLCLADLDPADRCAEMAFHFGIDGAAPDDIVTLLHQHGYQLHRNDFSRVHGRLRGMMTGIIDLVFRHGGQWWVVDYKTNHLGPQREDYAVERLPTAIAVHDYDLQYLIYTVALHRWLRLSLGDAYDYERDVGGIRYLFLRGMDPASGSGHGIYADKPSRSLIEALDELLRAPRGTKA